jgi:hypothetical protein
MTRDLEAWEDEGGAPPALHAASVTPLSGSAAQVEWANRIRLRVNADFDRVAAAFKSVAATQTAGRRAETEAVIAILEDKRSRVMNRTEAGYFIRDWQEISDQVRKLVLEDVRYETILSDRKRRRP